MGSSAVEVAFVSMGMVRQLLLVGLAIQIAGLGARHAWQPWLVAPMGVTVAAYLVVDKLLPYWLVALVGPDAVLSAGALWFRLVRFLFGPLAGYLSRTADRARALNRADRDDAERDDLGAFLDLAEEEGLVSESEEALLRGVADLDETTVREVMTPRVDVIAIDAKESLAQLRRLIAEHRFSRIPVVTDDLDHVVGLVNLKDLLAALQDQLDEEPVTSIVRPAFFVPESKRVSELLGEFQRRREQMAIVVDEYGGTAGLATLEDVLEEIVGEIQDEDEPEERLVKIRADGAIVAGKAEIEDVEEAIGRPIQEGEFHTIGGMVFTHLGRVPEPGERFDCADLHIEILEADDRRIHRIRITTL
jgi:CBS domain containing-hemolysin-like protein